MSGTTVEAVTPVVFQSCRAACRFAAESFLAALSIGVLAVCLAACGASTDDSATANADGCKEVVVEDDYGFQELIELCPGADEITDAPIEIAPEPTPDSTPTTLPVLRADPEENGPANPGTTEAIPLSPIIATGEQRMRPETDRVYRHDAAPSMASYVGTPDALNLLNGIRSRFIDLHGCPVDGAVQAPSDRFTEARAAIPDAAAKQALGDAMTLLAGADEVCNERDRQWVRRYRDAVMALEQFGALVDPGLGDPLVVPSVDDILGDPRILAGWSSSVYDRVAWALQQTLPSTATNLWRGSDHFAAVEGLLRLGPQGRSEIEGVVVGNSLTAEGVDSQRLSSARAAHWANLGVRGVRQEWQRQYIDLLLEVEGFRPAEIIWLVSAYEITSRCVNTGPSSATPTQDAFQRSQLLSETDHYDRMASAMAFDGPLVNSLDPSFLNWEQILGPAGYPADRTYVLDPADVTAYYRQPVERACEEWMVFLAEATTRWKDQGIAVTIVFTALPSWTRGLSEGDEFNDVVSRVAGLGDDVGFDVVDARTVVPDDGFRDVKGHTNQRGREDLTRYIGNLQE